MRTYFYIIKHAVKPEHKIHVWTFYIPMYQCAVSRNAAFLYAPSLSHLFFFQNSHFCIVFHKKSCKFRWTSLLQKLFHPILPFIHRQLFLYATPFQLCKVVVKYFYFEFIAIDTRHKTQMCMSHCWPVKFIYSEKATKLCESLPTVIFNVRSLNHNVNEFLITFAKANPYLS